MSDIKNYDLIQSEDELIEYVDRLISEGEPIALDVETSYNGKPRDNAALHPEENFIVGISFTNDTTWARYIPLAHKEAENFRADIVAKHIWQLVQSGLTTAHNANFELRCLGKFFLEHLSDDPIYGEAVKASKGFYPFLACTQIEAYIAAEHKLMGLKPQSKFLFDYDQAEIFSLFSDLKVKDRKKIKFSELELTPKVISYVCDDVTQELKLHNYYHPKVKDKFIYKVEYYNIPIVCEMEEFGVAYDWDFMRKAAEKAVVFKERMNAEIQAELSELIGEEVNVLLSSHPQMRELLFTKLGLTTDIRTEKGLPSTGDIVLKNFVEDYPVIKRIRQWKGISKLIGSYLLKYERDYNHAPDGRAHPSHKQSGTKAGRFSVSDPNYQQMPKKYRYLLNKGTEIVAAHKQAHANTVWAIKHSPSSFDDRQCSKENNCNEYIIPEGEGFFLNFRDAIIAPPNHYIFGYDYSMAELRVVAGEANETVLLRAFANGEDVHTTTAALMLGIPREEVTKDLRAIGKGCNFQLLYHMSAGMLGERLGIPYEEAKRYRKQWYQSYPSIEVWQERMVELGTRNGYAMTKFGRKVPIWEFSSPSKKVYAEGERLCINAPVQGSIADYVKISTYMQHNALKEAGLLDRVHLVMNIHDALEYYVHNSVKAQEVFDVLKDVVTPPVLPMLKAAGLYELGMPEWPQMVADWHGGHRWGTLLELDVVDGKLLRGDRVKEDKPPTVDEVDDDDSDTGIEPPKIDIIALRAALAKTAGDGRAVVIETVDMPTDSAFGRFVALLKDNPGPNVILLKTPEGEIELKTRTRLGPAAQVQISTALPEAVVYYLPEA